ncbi:MAG TPA: hypothetical protein VLM17_00700 [Xanthomonadaceae bacterium]|nr:hypothetical protein [Xanthomonadaceae bacterium]
MRHRLSTLLFLALVVATPAFANDDGVPATAGEIVQSQQALRAQLGQRNGQYANLDPATTDKIRVAQDQVFQLLTGVGSLDQLDDAHRSELTRLLGDIKALLATQPAPGMLCRRERQIGSNMIKQRCYKADDQAAQQARQQMMDLGRTH